MSDLQQHEMHLETTHPSGAEEWACPGCGRRFVAKWEPQFRRIILEQGNETTIHTGQGLGIQTQISVGFNEDIFSDDIELGDVWKKFLDQLDFGSEEDDDLTRKI